MVSPVHSSPSWRQCGRTYCYAVFVGWQVNVCVWWVISVSGRTLLLLPSISHRFPPPRAPLPSVGALYHVAICRRRDWDACSEPTGDEMSVRTAYYGMCISASCIS